MRRREFITLLGSSAMTWPSATRAQQPAPPVVGFLGSGSLQSDAFRLAAVVQGLTESGYVEGRKITTSDCRRWRPSWFIVGSPYSSQ
jgi:putative ABC transport system substrate-binding protein